MRYFFIFFLTICLTEVSFAGNLPWFNWDYTGPDTIKVGANCRAALVWGGDDKIICLTTFQGQEIIIKKLKSISGGYSYGDPIPGGVTVTVVYEATDNYGHHEEFSFTIAFVDRTPPVFNQSSLPPDITVQCPLNLPNYNVSAVDNCTPAFQIDISVQTNFPPAACSGNFTRIYTAKDAAGNSTSYTQKIALTPDITPPVVTTEAKNDTADCSAGNAETQFQSWITSQGGAAASDNCGIYEWLTRPANPVFDGNCGVPVTVTFIVRDFCGNRDSTTASFYVTDNVKPTLQSPAVDLLASCETDPLIAFADWLESGANADVRDNCSPDIQLSYRYHGQDISEAQLLDTLTAQLQLPCHQQLVGGVTYTDVKAYLNIEFIYADFCGNSVSDQAYFAIRDTTPPVLISPGQDTTLFSCLPGGLTQTFTDWYNSGAGASAQDNCGGVEWQGIPTLSEALDSLNSGHQSCDQSLSVRFTPRDDCGNVADTSFVSVFSIHDTDGPTFTVGAEDYQLSCIGNDGQDSLISWINRKGRAVIDDCNEPEWDHFSWISSTGDSGTGQFDVGPYPQADSSSCTGYIDLIFYAKDNCNNSSSDTARFNSGDNEPPVAVNPPLDTTIACSQNIPDFDPMFTDNCGLQGEVIFTTSSTQSIDLGTCAHYQYDITRSWTATDFCGNATTLSQIIHVVDTVAPEPLDDLSDLVLGCHDEIPEAQVFFNDDCSLASYTLDETSTFDPDENSCAHYTYSITRVYTAKDLCENTRIISRLISVQDTTPPSLAIGDTLELTCMDSAGIALVIHSLISDNCSDSVYITLHDLGVSDSVNCVQGVIRKFEVVAQDICLNTLQDTVIIRLIDHQPPTLLTLAQGVAIDCPDLDGGTAQLFAEWLQNNAGADATDECSSVSSFSAVPGSYSLTDPTTFPGIFPTWDSLIQCNNSSLISVPVDFVFYDQCGNAVVTTATFSISDTVPPVLIYCPADTIIVVNTKDCSAEYILPIITASDACSHTVLDTTLKATSAIHSSMPGNINIPVDTVTLSFGPLNFQNFSSEFSTGRITIHLDSVDGEGPGEYFDIYGEDLSLLGTTMPTDSQCGHSITTVQLTETQFNSWKSDNYIQLYLAPHDPALGSQSINDICIGSMVGGEMPVSLGHSALLQYAYAIDDNTEKVYDLNNPPIEKLREGMHQITYTARDCGNNSVQCIQQVFIKDTMPPAIACPGDINVDLASNSCDTLLSIPLPTKIEDNCGLGDNFLLIVPSDTASAWLIFEQNNDLHNFLAKDKIFTFNDVHGSVNAPVRLNIYLKGDIESGGEFFNIYDENDVFLGKTEAGQGNVLTGGCTKVSTIYFNIPAAKFNSLALDGSVTFKAVSNRNFSIPPDNQFSGVNPCPPSAVTMDGQTDSSSYMFMELIYTSYTPPSYYTTGATVIPLTELQPPYSAPRLTMNAGKTIFHYTIKDRSDNADTCSFEINVNDLIPPTAICKEAIVHLHPSGIIPGILLPAQIDGGSRDNCGIDSLYVSRDSFMCADVDHEFEVKLFVIDKSGNVDSCTTKIKVAEAILNPQYSLGLCDNDTLRLYSNMPDTLVFNSYTYSWTGPNGFTSNLKNPRIPNATALNSGSYTLKVQGFNGCTGTGIVQVFINSEINTPLIFIEDTSVCAQSVIRLSTQAYNGNIVYKWFEGQAPNGVLLDSTIVPKYELTRPSGIYSFYVLIRENDCVSNPSASITVKVRDLPIALLDTALIAICEGGSIALGTPVNGPQITYQWIGPNGFNSSLQYPPVIAPARLADAGTYRLIIIEDECRSLPAEVIVSVDPKPATPTPFSNSPVCLNSLLVLTSNISAGIDSFIWKKPDGTLITTNSNRLEISNATAAENGLWTLTLMHGGCRSDESVPILVEVQNMLLVEISYDGPLCEGDSVQLSATEFVGATYQWSGPNGFTSGSRIPWVKSAYGKYTVQIRTTSGCVATAEIYLNLFPKPRVRNLTSTATSCQHPEDVVRFNYQLNMPSDSVTYMWRGPNGFASTDSFPSIAGTQLKNGIYSLIITSLRGCISDTARISIQVELTPPKPIVMGNLKLCSGENLVLTVTNQVGGGQYTWQTPQGPVVESTNQLTLNNTTSQQSGIYIVTYTLGNCTSKSSDTILVRVVQTPPQPVISGDPTICLGDTIRLETSVAAGLTYAWTGPGGLTSTQPSWIIYPASVANAGVYTLRISRDGCQSPISEAFTVIINTPPTAPVLSDLGGDICVGQDQLTLCITPGSALPGATYTFYNSNAPAAIAGPTNALCAQVFNFSPFVQGLNTLYATSTLEGCISQSSVPISVNVSIPPEELARAGADQIICTGREATLTADQPAVSTGYWKALTLGTSILNSKDAITVASNLTIGENKFVWILDYNTCKGFSKDTVSIWVPELIRVLDDLYSLPLGEEGTFTVTDNDQFTGRINVSIGTPPISGSTVINADQTITYLPAPGSNSGYDKFTYTVCLQGCDICQTATVLIDINDPNSCIIPNILTPNGDHINDILRINCLENGTPNTSELAVFNEWGTEVYRSTPYLNDWDGTYDGKPLPVGTYFYIFFSAKSAPVQKGFLIIKR